MALSSKYRTRSPGALGFLTQAASRFTTNLKEDRDRQTKMQDRLAEMTYGQQLKNVDRSQEQQVDLERDTRNREWTQEDLAMQRLYGQEDEERKRKQVQEDAAAAAGMPGASIGEVGIQAQIDRISKIEDPISRQMQLGVLMERWNAAGMGQQLQGNDSFKVFQDWVSSDADAYNRASRSRQSIGQMVQGGPKAGESEDAFHRRIMGAMYKDGVFQYYPEDARAMQSMLDRRNGSGGDRDQMKAIYARYVADAMATNNGLVNRRSDAEMEADFRAFRQRIGLDEGEAPPTPTATRVSPFFGQTATPVPYKPGMQPGAAPAPASPGTVGPAVPETRQEVGGPGAAMAPGGEGQAAYLQNMAQGQAAPPPAAPGFRTTPMGPGETVNAAADTLPEGVRDFGSQLGRAVGMAFRGPPPPRAAGQAPAPQADLDSKGAPKPLPGEDADLSPPDVIAVRQYALENGIQTFAEARRRMEVEAMQASAQ